MRRFGIAIAGLMSAAIVYGFTAGSGFGDEGSQLLALAWGRVTIIDLYLMLAVFAAWVWRREQNRMVALAWTIALVGLGSVAAGVYLIRAAGTARKELV